MAPDRSADALRLTLVTVAPGMPLREGIERIIRADSGALIVLGDGPAVQPLVSGGFRIDEDFTAQRLSELAKMDGAVVLTADAARIVRANVHLVPDPQIPTKESGTRHRTAERVARQTSVPVIAVSQSMRVVTVYVGSARHALEEVPQVMARANNALQTLERYRQRLDEVMRNLSALEIEDIVTVRDVASAVQRAEMVRRIAGEIDALVAELGVEGRLLKLHLDELMGGIEEERRLVVRDYVASRRTTRKLEASLRDLDALSPEDLLDPVAVAKALRLAGGIERLEDPVSPHGFRLLSKIPRVPEAVVARLVGRFGGLQPVMSATLEDLLKIEGVGAARAGSIRDGLARLAESSILRRPV